MSVRRPLGCALAVALVVSGLAACTAGKHSSAATGTPAGQSASAVLPVADKVAPPPPAAPVASPSPSPTPTPPPAPAPSASVAPKKAATTTTASAARAEDVSHPDKVIGDGTPGSCTSAAVADAVRSGGTVTFSCGPDPITIVVTETLHVCNTTTCQHAWAGGTPVSKLVVDGGGLVTLSGGGQRGIFYANACEESFGWLNDHCQTESRPFVVFQNIGFVDGEASNGPAGLDDVRGGGAIAMRSGRLKVVNATFRNNRCMDKDSDGGGGAIRVAETSQPAYVVNSTIDNNQCANGGGISILHATLHVIGSTITNNTATGIGANDGQGGNGGGIYSDGTSESVTVDGSLIQGNHAPEGGPGVFYVSNDRTGNLVIKNTRIIGNSGQSFFTAPYRSIYYLGNGPIQISGSTVE